MEAAAQCVALVLIEMGLSFSGIVFNLLIVATLRQEASERIAFKWSYFTHKNQPIFANKRRSMVGKLWGRDTTIGT